MDNLILLAGIVLGVLMFLHYCRTCEYEDGSRPGINSVNDRVNAQRKAISDLAERIEKLEKTQADAEAEAQEELLHRPSQETIDEHNKIRDQIAELKARAAE